MPSTKAIAKEELDRAHKRLCRQVAIMVVVAMRETGADFKDIDERLGNPAGTAQATVLSFITAQTTELRVVSDMAYAMGCEANIHAVIPRAVAETQEADNV